MEYRKLCRFKILEIKPIKKLYSVAASFKPNMILHKFGFYDDTEVVFYDYSKQALAFKKLLIKEWDGEDYPSFLDYAVQNIKLMRLEEMKHKQCQENGEEKSSGGVLKRLLKSIG